MGILRVGLPFLIVINLLLFSLWIYFHKFGSTSIRFTADHPPQQLSLQPDLQGAKMKARRSFTKLEQEKVMVNISFDEPLVYGVWESPKEDRTFYVFALGVREVSGEIKHTVQKCVIGLDHGIIRVEALEQKGGIIKCKYNSKIEDHERISVQLENGYLLPSLVDWGMRTANKIADQRKRFLCFATMVKNEESDIRDWIEYHSYQGGELFVIYNNNSTDKTGEYIKLYNHTMEIKWPWPKSQREAFLHATLLTETVCEWTAFIDVDEFIYPSLSTSEPNITFFDIIHRLIPKLTRFNQNLVSKIHLKSKPMGPTGWIQTPNISLAEAYVEDLPWKDNIKSVIRPNKATHMDTSIHDFSMVDKTISLPLKKEYAYIYHYKFQSWQHHLKKFDRGRAGFTRDWFKLRPRPKKPTGLWTKHDIKNDTTFRDYRRRIEKIDNY